MGIESHSILLRLVGRSKEADLQHQKAASMAVEWEKQAVNEDHTILAFGDKESWSIKYNLIWDLIFESKLFSKQLFSNEVKWYLRHSNRYGTPLDNRVEYTKSDWLLWAASLTDSDDDMQKMISLVEDYILHTPSRVPFADWYHTVTGEMIAFHNRTVQGGLFMPLLKKKFSELVKHS